MFTTILSSLVTAIDRCFQWLSQIDLRISFLPSVLAVFGMYTVTRLLLKPLIGQAASDKARAIRKGNKNSNNE